MNHKAKEIATEALTWFIGAALAYLFGQALVYIYVARLIASEC